MNATRIVQYDEGVAGIWSMTCAECPMRPHTDVLGQRPPECAGGIATNMQGPLMLRSCRNLVAGSFANDDQGRITVGCCWSSPV